MRVSLLITGGPVEGHSVVGQQPFLVSVGFRIPGLPGGIATTEVLLEQIVLGLDKDVAAQELRRGVAADTVELSVRHDRVAYRPWSDECGKHRHQCGNGD